MSQLRTTSDGPEPVFISKSSLRSARRDFLVVRAGQPNVSVTIIIPNMAVDKLKEQIENMPVMINCTIISGNIEIVCMGLFYELKTNAPIPPNAFRGCKRVRKVVIQAQSRRTTSFTGSILWTDAIGKNAFKDCVNLESVKFVGTRYTVIGAYAFCDCTSLRQIIFPEDQSDDVFLTIKPYAFHACTALTTLYIAPGVTGIEGAAFSDCTGLTVVQISEPPAKRKDIGRAAFPQGVRLEYVEIPVEGMCSIQYQKLNF
jgi:hypothetical protein